MSKFNVKTTDKKIIEVDGKLIKKSTQPKAPAWFNQWSESFEKKIDQRFENIDQRIDNIDRRLDNLVKVNNLKEN